MKTRTWILDAGLSIALIAAVSGDAAAQYNYGSSGGGGGDDGFVITIEGMLANPRNTDSIVVTEVSGSSLFPSLPAWDDDVAGAVEVGYAFSNGNRLRAGLWSYRTDRLSSGNSSFGGNLAFAVGPPIVSGGSVFGAQGAPGSYDITTEIEASTADLAFSRNHELGEAFSMEWSAGLRYAKFTENYFGQYDEGSQLNGVNSFAANKSNEAEMLGVRLGVRGSYRFGSFSVDGGLGFSMLDGEIDSFSTLTPNGSANSTLPTGRLVAFDDGRSGQIRDFELVGTWHSESDRVRLFAGWSQAEWSDIATDLVRNAPETVVPLRDRNSVTISGVKLGLTLQF